MTKVTLHYDLSRPLETDDFPNIASLHSVYGIVRVLPSTALDKITVDYDASRMMKKDVEATLARFGVPVKAPVPA
ncbi:MAG: hypothetical protein ABI811_18100 [Acidobacteriota bacterium]